MIIAGTRTMGKVDDVPGVGHVATQFFHVWFFPLVPLRSLVVEDGAERAVSIPMSWKSVAVGYFRGWALMGGIAFLLLAGYCAYEVYEDGIFARREVSAYYDSNGVRQATYVDDGLRMEAIAAPVLGGLAVVGWLAALASYKLLGASASRRAEILQKLGRAG